MAFSAEQLKQMANAARSYAVAALRAAGSGHLGIALGAADIITTLFANHLRFNPGMPDWTNRDRFVLSAGHGSALFYSVLKLSGYALPDLTGFRKFDSPLSGHPEYKSVPGVEYSTGPLGQGIAAAVGMALGAKMRAARNMGAEYRVYCLVSDGDLMEGIAGEAIALAGGYGLDNLVILWDDNDISIDGVALTEPNVPERMAAAGFHIIECDGNDVRSVNAAIAAAKKSKHPVFIQCKTTIGLGSSVAGTNAAHGLAVSNEELVELEKKFASDTGLGLWNSIPFASALVNGDGQLGVNTATSFLTVKKSGAAISTRAASGKVLAELVKKNPEIFIGGSADLAISTNTKTEFHRDISADDFSGNFVNYGVREGAMAAIMNGLCLSGFCVYGGTFLAFSDYMRPAMRLSAMMKLPVVYVFTHDSIAVGEDGPTHQPVEQIASLRLIPNMNVFRPADITEVAAAWEIALSDKNKTSCIVLSRQNLPEIPTSSANGARMGGYLVATESGKPRAKITLVATGSEVSLALAVQKKLAEKNIGANVASMPCVEIFRNQVPEYKNKILNGYVVAIEAGATYGWYEFADAVAGIDGFGVGGPGVAVYRHFGFDADTIANDIIASKSWK